MLHKFRSYQLALELHKSCKGLKIPGYLKDQLERASLSVVLNIAEGSAKPTKKDQRRFYAIAFGSCRETEALLEILEMKNEKVLNDRVAACLYRLVHPR